MQSLVCVCVCLSVWQKQAVKPCTDRDQNVHEGVITSGEGHSLTVNDRSFFESDLQSIFAKGFKII